MFKPIVACVVALVVGSSAHATTDYLAVTYHAIPDMGEEEITIVPVYFLTDTCWPETELNAVAKPNQMDQRSNAHTKNANLISCME